ncbi:hypothetical protein K461DRAFT_276584 [Myriangium duriaei CBS 260.36]|uniref:Uncharacterized protein n=1 Tax=Myriangium duriaei CBS 260.36 TaxID=1168546 RepID=A0A9P4J8H0_9PEZI|nr:hypothetical protein K461DRAFT_276584 [Myriangium duriaei CBS 260.36]
MTISSPNSRPWNFDENYPWSSEFSLREKERESITSNLLRDAATTPSKNDRTVMSLASRSGATDVDFSSPSEQGLDPTATVTADTLTAQHTRKISKKAASLLGSLSRRAKLSPLRPSTESKRSARRPATSATVLSGKSHASQVHAGDRYPSTALQAPIGYDVDEMRSYFSDENGSRNSSALGVRRRETRSSKLKKRLSDIRFKPEIRIRPASEVHDSAQIVEQANRDSGMGFSLHSAQHGDEGIGSDTDHAAPGVAFYGLEGGHGVPAGMSRVEFRMKRLGERVRSALAKGGALLRRVSGRAKQERLRREQQDWVDVSGSVYSGT